VLVLAALVPVLGFAARRHHDNSTYSSPSLSARHRSGTCGPDSRQELETAVTALEALAESQSLDAAACPTFRARLTTV
jgi:hypothetical protein